MAQGNDAGRPWRQHADRLVLTSLGLLSCAWRLRYYSEPLDNDITIRMDYAARAIAGDSYYSDLFVFGPAGALWFNELFQRLFGASELAVYMMGCVFSVLTMLGVYRCARLLATPSAGLVAAITWAVINGDLFTQANQPNAEVIINAGLVWGFALVLDERSARRPLNLIIAGLLFFFVSSVKHFMALTPILAAMSAVGLPRRIGSGWTLKPDQRALRSWIVVGGIAAAAWAVLLGWYALTGRLSLLRRALFGDALRYATQQHGLAETFLHGIRPGLLLPVHQRGFGVLYLMLVAAVLIGLLRTQDERWRLILAWSIGTWACVSFSGRFFPHYYMLWLPLIAIGAGAVFALARMVASPRLAAAVRVMVVLALFAIGIRQVAQLSHYGAEKAVLAKYPVEGPLFLETSRVGKHLAEALPADRTLFEIGVYGLYFYAGRPAPAPFVDSLYGSDPQFPAEYRAIMLPKLRASPPSLLVVRRSLLEHPSEHALAVLLADFVRDVSYSERMDLRSDLLAVLERSSTGSGPRENSQGNRVQR